MGPVDFTGAACSLCGVHHDGDDRGQVWLGVALRRVVPHEGRDWLVFCSQQHASEWFLRPLPLIDGPEGLKPPTLRERLGMAVGLAVLCLLAALLMLGASTALRFLVGLIPGGGCVQAC